MATGLIEIIKVAAMDAIENSKPSDLKFGTVTSVSPLKVMISNNFILPESLLIVPQHLTDYSVVTNVGSGGDGNSSGTTGGSSVDMYVIGETLMVNTTAGVSVIDTDSTDEVDNVDDRNLTVYNGLTVGDKVVLLRNQGGTSYLILDRI